MASEFADRSDGEALEAPGPGRRSSTGDDHHRLDKATRPIREKVNAARQVETVGTLVHGLQVALDVANSVSRQVMVTGGALSPLFDDHSMMSRLEVFSVPRMRQASRALGGSRNDLLVAAAASGLGLYHARMGEPCAELRLATPAVHGRGQEIGGNWFVPARVQVPTVWGHPGPLFGMVAERLAQARQRTRATPDERVSPGVSAACRCG